MKLLRNIKFSEIPFYPFLFGLFPVLYLWSANRTQQPAYVVVPSLLVTLAASQVLSVDRLVAFADSFVWPVFHWVRDVVVLILYRWIMLFGFLLEPFVRLVRWMQSRRQPQEPPQQEQAPPDPLMEEIRNQKPADLSYLVPYVEAGLVILFVLGLLWFIYRLSKWQRTRGPGDEEEVVSLGFWPNLLADLKGLFSRRPAGGTALAVEAESLAPRDPRMLYRRLQAWGLLVGRPRSADETPNRYGQLLAERRPDQEPSVAAVTAVYNEARYGRTPPPADAVNEAAEAVEKLEEAPR